LRHVERVAPQITLALEYILRLFQRQQAEREWNNECKPANQKASVARP
jgi:hypothetical protein